MTNESLRIAGMRGREHNKRRSPGQDARRQSAPVRRPWRVGRRPRRFRRAYGHVAARVQRGAHSAQPRGTSREHHQRRRPHGRLVMHTRRAPRAHRSRVQCRQAGPAGSTQRVHEQREYCF